MRGRQWLWRGGAAAMLALLLGGGSGLDDGLAQSPPMGWRSWNQFGLFINQSLMEQQYEALADRSRMVDGLPTSLLDLGYQHAAIDDGWQLCDSGPGGTGFHNATGYPNVNSTRFPSMAAMTAKARSLGLRAGWYENNAHCADHEYGSYNGLVRSTLEFGFEGIKMDRAGRMTNASEVAALFNASGARILQENNDAKAHRGVGGGVVCPMHFFRTGLDIRPTHGSVVKGMQSVRQYNEGGLTGPGCWAHADMLAVGVTEPQPPGAKHICSTATARCSLNWTEMRSNFGAWCVISNPLVLAMDLRNKSALDWVWPIISNREAIAVNQQWSGDSGRLLAQSSAVVTLSNCGSGTPCQLPQWMVWSKALPPPHGRPQSSRAALFLLNNNDASTQVLASLLGVRGLGACGSAGCSVRDVWDRSDLPVTRGDGLVSAALVSPGALCPAHARCCACRLIALSTTFVPAGPPRLGAVCGDLSLAAGAAARPGTSRGPLRHAKRALRFKAARQPAVGRQGPAGEQL